MKYIDVDQREVPNEDEFKANGQDESISGMLDIELMMPRKCFFYFKCSFQFFIVKLPNKIRFSISINQKLAKALIDASFWTKIIPSRG